MNLHRIVDGVAAIAIVMFLLLEHVFYVEIVPETYMTLGDVALHVTIFGSFTWHVAWEKLRG